MKEYFNVKEAAEYLGVKEQTIRCWLMQGKISHYKVGNCVRFKKEQLDSLVTVVPVVREEV